MDDRILEGDCSNSAGVFAEREKSISLKSTNNLCITDSSCSGRMVMAVTRVAVFSEEWRRSMKEPSFPFSSLFLSEMC